jgi:hypothetical protein
MSLRSVFHSLFKPRWRYRAAPEVWDEIMSLLTSDAMRNRVSLYPETLRLHVRAMATGAEGEGHDAGALLGALVVALAKQSGKPTPETPAAILQFFKSELQGFDTPEADERAARAELDEMYRIMKGGDP